MTKKVKNVLNVPNLRFPGFSQEWRTKKLKEVAEFKVTNSFSRKDLNYENGTAKNIHYGDIHTKFQTLFDITKEDVPYVNEDIPIDRISEESYCKEGDIVFADASEDLNDVGKSIEIVSLNNEKLLSGLHTLLARPKPNYFQKGFNGYLFKSNTIRYQIQKEAQGTKVLSINVGRISKITLSFPSISEQKKIADFLLTVDSRIHTQSKTIEEYKLLKKGMMQKIFAREIRFKDENGKNFPEWQEKRLGEICKKKSSNISANSLAENIGKYKIYGATGFLQNINFYKEDKPYISIVKDGAGVGRTLLCEKKSSVLGTLDVLKPTTGNDIGFLYALLSTIHFEKYITGSTIPHIYFKDYSKEKVFVPQLKEQQKIASTLSAIDEKIAFETKLLEAFTEQKKYFLQNLFI